MNNLGELFSDDYNFETLVLPAIILLLPILVILFLLGVNVNWLIGFAILGVQVLFLPVFVVSSNIRNMGKKVEQKIFPKYFPTTKAVLLTVHKTDRRTEWRRTNLERLSGVALPSKRSEQNNLNSAIFGIENAIVVAREKTRDPKKFKLLRRELKSYGYWRNMYAVKSWAIVLTNLSLIIAILYTVNSNDKKIGLGMIAFSLLILLFWVLGVTKSKVEDAAERYCTQFYNSLTNV